MTSKLIMMISDVSVLATPVLIEYKSTGFQLRLQFSFRSNKKKLLIAPRINDDGLARAQFV
jgi:hypothetical protein